MIRILYDLPLHELHTATLWSSMNVPLVEGLHLRARELYLALTKVRISGESSWLLGVGISGYLHLIFIVVDGKSFEMSVYDSLSLRVLSTHTIFFAAKFYYKIGE